MNKRCALLALSSALLLSGCADISPVILELPVNRMEMPERSAGVVNLGVGGGGENYLILTRDQVTTAPDTQHPEVDSCPASSDGDAILIDTSSDCSGGIYLRGDLRLSDVMQIGVRRSADSLLVGQMKLYLVGPKPGRAKAGDNSLAITGAYGHDRVSTSGNDDDGNESRSDLERSLRDAGVVFGHRWLNWVMTYGGAYYSRSDYSGSSSHWNGNQTIKQDLRGDAALRGVNIGLKFNFGTPLAGALLECARARVNSGDTQTYVNRCMVGMEVTFGGYERQRQPRKRKENEAPVRVVPVEPAS
jgi:hypothetical protein